MDGLVGRDPGSMPLLLLRLASLLLDVGALVPPAIHGGDGAKAGHLGKCVGSMGGGDLERGPLVVEERLHRLPEVFDEMKPIHDLHRVGRSTPNAVSVQATPIPTDDGHGWMLG